MLQNILAVDAVVLEAARELDHCQRPRWILVGGWGTRLRTKGGESLHAELAGLSCALAGLAQFIERGSIDYTPRCSVLCTSHFAKAFEEIVTSLQ